MGNKIIFCTVSDDRSGRKGGLYGATQAKIERLFKLNEHFGEEHRLLQVHVTFDDLLNTAFYEEYKVMLIQPNAAHNGRLYKPYVIRQALALAQDGDYIIYSDCSPEMWPMAENFVIDPEVYSLDIITHLTAVNNDVLTAFVRWDDKQIFPGEFGVHTHDNFTLESCIDIMKAEQCRHSFQCASGMICLRKTPATVGLVDNWFYYNSIKECSCMNVDETEDSYYTGRPGSKLGNRHDQSVLSILLNQGNYNYVDIVYNDLSPYNFLNFCRKDTAYHFINSNTPKIEL